MQLSFILKINLLHKLVIVSGILSLLLSLYLHFHTMEQVAWTKFILLVTAPALLTLLLFALYLSDKMNHLFTARVMTLATAVKVLLISVSIALMFVQLFAFSGWFMSVVEGRRLPAVMHFLGYFFMVGLVYNVYTLYQLTRPGSTTEPLH